MAVWQNNKINKYPLRRDAYSNCVFRRTDVVCDQRDIIGFGGTINKEGQPRSQVLSPTRRETLVGSVSTWRVSTLTCLPESGRLQTNVLREGQIIVRFVSAGRWSKVQSWNCVPDLVLKVMTTKPRTPKINLMHKILWQRKRKRTSEYLDVDL